MATSFKTFDDNSTAITRNLLHEAIPITGSIVSGTYADLNIKNFSHGMFQSVYDYPFLSSSANHIFDLTAGYPANSHLASAGNTQNAKKINIYNEMAQVLVGYDSAGAIREFDEDGDFAAVGTKNKEAYFINFSRLLTKDEIKKGSFTLELGATQAYATPFTDRITLKDTNAASIYKINSPAGEYGILYVSNSAGVPLDGITGSTQQAAGLIYYQAGIAVVSGSVFDSLLSSSVQMNPAGEGVDAILTGSAISGNCDALRHRVRNISFNNTVELNSTIYYCRVNNTDFNYSSNPTYLSSSKLVVKNNSQDLPVSYMTTVGLYSPDNELLAVAKLSEPLKKDPSTEFTLRVRLDY